MAARTPPGIVTDLVGSHAQVAARTLLEFRCAGCGYGARCAVAPDRCPTCSGAIWDSVRPTPFDEWDATAPLTRER